MSIVNIKIVFNILKNVNNIQDIILLYLDTIRY